MVDRIAPDRWRSEGLVEYTLGTLPVGAMFWEQGPGLAPHLVVMCPDNYLWDIDGSGCGDPRPHRCWSRHGEPPNITVDMHGSGCGGHAGSVATRADRNDPRRYHGFLYKGVLSDNLVGVACNPADRAKQTPRDIPNRIGISQNDAIASITGMVGSDDAENFLSQVFRSRLSAEEKRQRIENALRVLDIAASAGDSAEDVAAWFTLPNPLLAGANPTSCLLESNPSVEVIARAATIFVTQSSPAQFEEFIRNW